MTAPEDQNGLREALARAEAERDAAVSNMRKFAAALNVASEDIRAAEAENARLKEEMEAAPTEAQITMGAAACIDVWCGGKSWRTAEGDGPSQEFMAGADWEMAVTLTKAVLATLSPKEHP